MSHGFPLFWHSRRETKTSSKIKLKTNSNSSPSLTFNSLLCISRVLHRTGNLLHRGSFNSLISSIKNQCQFNTCDLLILDFNLPGCSNQNCISNFWIFCWSCIGWNRLKIAIIFLWKCKLRKEFLEEMLQESLQVPGFRELRRNCWKICKLLKRKFQS